MKDFKKNEKKKIYSWRGGHQPMPLGRKFVKEKKKQWTMKENEK
jgi:hypothetical protein